MSIADRRGSIRKRGTTWTAQIEVEADHQTGRRKFRTKGGFERRKDAQAQLDLWRRMLAAGSAPTAPGRRRVNELATDWLNSQKNVVKPTTYRSYDDAMRLHVLPTVGGLWVRDLDAGAIGRLAEVLRTKVTVKGRNKDKPLSAASQKYQLRVVSTFCGWAVEQGELPHNPVELYGRRQRKTTAAARSGRTEPVGRDLPWGKDELGRFLDAVADHPMGLVFRLALASGARRGEVCGLRWDAVDLDAGTITIRRSRVTVGGQVIDQDTTKGGTPRMVRLPDATVAELVELRRARVVGIKSLKVGPVFVNEAGDPIHPQDVTDTFRDVIRVEGLPHLRLHDLRHLHATHLLDQGHSVVAVARRLGHSRTSTTTDVYGHREEGADGRAAESAGLWLHRDAR